MATINAPTKSAAAEPHPPEPEPARPPLRDAPQAAPLDPASFRSTLEFVKAKPDELKWASIPWQTDLWDSSTIGRPTRWGRWVS